MEPFNSFLGMIFIAHPRCDQWRKRIEALLADSSVCIHVDEFFGAPSH
jgi:hypothetical protein